MYNKILEEIGKSFGRQLFEVAVSQGVVTLVTRGIDATIEVIKTKKILEISRQYGIDPNSMLHIHPMDEEDQYEESQEELQEPEPEPEPKKRKKKRKKDKGTDSW